MNQTEKLQKILMQQVELLHEESRRSRSLSGLADASRAMAELAGLLMGMGAPDYIPQGRACCPTGQESGAGQST